jgi:propionate catabolism operon transcriptional regulator
MDDRRAARAGTPRKPVIWTVSVSRLTALLRDVAPEFDGRAQIETISLGFDEAARHIQARLADEDCDVILAAGSNGAYLRNRLGKPVVLIKASGFDLMQALTRARKLSPRIGVVTHETEVPVFAAFQQSFGLAIEQRAFVTAEDARSCVAELVADGIRVIVGTGMVADLAEQAGVAGILLYSADSVRSAFEHALDLARMLDDADAAPPRRPALRARRPAARGDGLASLVGETALMQQLRARVLRYGASPATVLISGETGTGKELVARALHAASPRREQAFIAVNCGAIAESLLESELFGYEEGAFTGSRRGGRVGLIEAAHGGTLFLDEIGEMPLPLQTRLLRVLEEREVVRVGSSRAVPVDLRVIAATHCDLDRMVQANRFRRDLYFRLNVLRLQLPILAERREDIALLAQRFLQQASGARLTLGADALALLQRYHWPGNVRELRNIIERLPVLHAEAPGRIDAGALREAAPELATLRSALPAVAPTGNGAREARPDRAALALALSHAGGDRTRAAALLGVSRTTLWRWLKAPA